MSTKFYAVGIVQRDGSDREVGRVFVVTQTIDEYDTIKAIAELLPGESDPYGFTFGLAQELYDAGSGVGITTVIGGAARENPVIIVDGQNVWFETWDGARLSRTLRSPAWTDLWDGLLETYNEGSVTYDVFRNAIIHPPQQDDL